MKRTIAALGKIVTAQAEKISYLDGLERLINFQQVIVDREAARKHSNCYYQELRRLQQMMRWYEEALGTDREGSPRK